MIKLKVIYDDWDNPGTLKAERITIAADSFDEVLRQVTHTGGLLRQLYHRLDGEKCQMYHQFIPISQIRLIEEHPVANSEQSQTRRES